MSIKKNFYSLTKFFLYFNGVQKPIKTRRYRKAKRVGKLKQL
jgi:hypothetical protein